MCALTSGKYVSEPAMSIPNLSQKLRFFWSHSSFFSLEKQPKKLNFHGLFISKIMLGGYFSATHALTSRKNASGKAVSIPISSQKLRSFRWHSSVFALVV